MKSSNEKRLPQAGGLVQNDFCVAYDTAVSSLRCIPALRHVSREKLCEAALDITIVAFGIRTGYLFDAFAMRDRRVSLKDVLVEYLTGLREVNQHFRDVVIAYEMHAEQLFFVNVQKLGNHVSTDERPLSTTGTDAQRRTSVTYILLRGSRAQITEAPPGVQSLIHKAVSDFNNGRASPVINLAAEEPAQDIGTLVAFAASILDFPVAYVPACCGDTAYLAGVPLDVYECVLVIDDDADAMRSYGLPRQHTVIKFSCPQHIARTITGLFPETLVHDLRIRLRDRLHTASVPGKVVVKHSMEILDRVAL
ncbi:hypothetical protein GY45DRAFT_1296451 [Cubamyces sp. BRFM 1775]|nr:hypothetical protein GY45DRAFT_1296451 [Cubamyces sp. BRFM 1775]